jgi:hypothetical protein
MMWVRLIRSSHVRPGYLAGGARRRVTFFACAKKVTKESTPRFRRNPEAADLERAAKELASLKQLSPAFGFPAQARQPRLRQRGNTRRMSLRLSALKSLWTMFFLKEY